ncbi:MAG: KH domain-containing protein [Bacilli bacterium]|nr:KH domain-containing protein [Bacilli bacterium]
MIKVYNYVGQTEDECKLKCIEELDVYACDIITKTVEEDGQVKVDIIKKEDIINYIKEYISNVAKSMNLEINLEVRESEEIFNVVMISDNNSILIGKDGRTLNSLQTLIRQSIQNETGFNIKVNLDASNYRAKKVKYFEYDIKNIVREVQKTKMDIKLDPMNSYQRRIVHSLVSNYDNIETESVGEEPNRCVVIKYIGK